MATGLARVTVSTPQRRLDVALPEQAPVAELLPELVRHAGTDPDGGWVLRRADGSALLPARGLAAQGIVDGAVLHLSPARLEWPQLGYDDLAEAVAAAGRVPRWTGAATANSWSVVAVVLLAGGLAVSLWHGGDVTPLLPAAVAGAGLLSGAVADRYRRRVAGMLLGVSAMGYACVAGLRWAPVDTAAAAGAAALLVVSLLGFAAGAVARAVPPTGGESALDTSAVDTSAVDTSAVDTSAVDTSAVDTSAGDTSAGGDRPARRGGWDSRCVYLAGATVGLLGVPVGLAATWWDPVGAAAVLACVLVCGVGVLPMAAMRLGGLPVPALGAAHPSPAVWGRYVTESAVARADEVLTGGLVGWAVLAVAATGALMVEGGLAGLALAAITGVALALRSRLFVAVRHRLPLLAAGLVGSALVATALVAVTPVSAAPVVVALAAGAGLVAAGGGWVGGVPPWASRAADVLDTLAIVAVVPVAAAVLNLYPAALTVLTA